MSISWGNTPLPAGPRKFGLLLYDQWELLDVAGPIECLNQLCRGISHCANEEYRKDQVYLSIISSQHESDPRTMPEDLPCNQVIRTWYDIQSPPTDLDVLIVPGGWGPRFTDERNAVVNFIAKYWKGIKDQKNKYLITVCTGSNLAAAAHVLDRLPATTNKMAYASVVENDYAKNTYWVAQARYIKTSQIWTTSGVSAGTDGFLAWMNDIYGSEWTNNVINMMEYETHGAWNEDPFGKNLVDKKIIADVPSKSVQIDWQGGKGAFPQPKPIVRTWVGDAPKM